MPANHTTPFRGERHECKSLDTSGNAEGGGRSLSLPTLVPAAALGRGGAAPASEKVRVGVIGCGGRAGLIPEATA